MKFLFKNFKFVEKNINTYNLIYVQNFQKFQKFNFTTKKSESFDKKLNIKEIQEKLNKEGSVKIYDSKYTFNSEKLLIHGSLIFLTISTTTIFFSHVSTLLKVVNFIFLFTPSFLIQLERFLNHTRFIKMIKILPENKIEVVNMWGRKEVIKIEDLNKAAADPRVKDQKDYLNNNLFFIFTNKNNTALYHVPREGVFLNEDLFENIIEGKML